MGSYSRKIQRNDDQAFADSQAKAELRDEADVQTFFKSDMGRDLGLPGATFRLWRNTTPSNIWIETEDGGQAHHSEERGACPVRDAFALLKRCGGLELTSEGQPGEEVYVLSKVFVAKMEMLNLDTNTGSAPSGTMRKTRL